MSSAPSTKKCFIVFNNRGDKRFLIEAVDTATAALAAWDSHRISVGDVQEVDCDITEEQFNQIEPRPVEEFKALQARNTAPQSPNVGFLAGNGPDKFMIIGGIVILLFFALFYDPRIRGVANLLELQNRNIGCAVGLVLAAVGAVRIAIANKR